MPSTENPSGSPELIPDFLWDSCWSIFNFCVSLFVFICSFLLVIQCHCIVCNSSNDCFWIPFWFLQTVSIPCRLQNIISYKNTSFNWARWSVSFIIFYTTQKESTSSCLQQIVVPLMKSNAVLTHGHTGLHKRSPTTIVAPC